MTYLLDTRYMLWAVAETKKISKPIREIITDPGNRIIVSAVSFWEVSLKSALGKLDIGKILPQELPQACLEIGFEIEDLSAAISSTYHQLEASHHKDPFDRMLIWQAIQGNYILITADKTVKKYTSEGLKILANK